MALEIKSKPSSVIQESSTIETLPVVEIRPFTRQVWRREKSFPEFYNKPPETNQKAEERYYPGENLPNIVEVLSDITQTSNQPTEDDQKRMRSKIHPKMPNINVNTSCKTSNSIMTAFITKDDRTKTTLFMSKQEENPKSFSCRKQALNSATVRRHQQMKLDGDSMNHPDELPKRFVYLNPLANYKERALKHMKYRQSHHNSAPSDDRTKDVFSLPGKELGIFGVPRKRSASKLRLRPLSASKRGETKGVLERNTSEDSHKNAFVFTDHKPIIIEKQLEHERTFHLDRCRKRMDIGYTSLELLQHLHNENVINRPLTQGEKAIQKGKIQNTTTLKQGKKTVTLVPVSEPNRRRGKILSIRRIGPDPSLPPKGRPHRRKSLKVKKEDGVVENNSIGSDVSMASENGEKAMSCSESDSMVSEDSQDMKANLRAALPSDQEDTPTLNTPAKESHTQSPLIEIVAQVNFDTTATLLRHNHSVTDTQLSSLNNGDNGENDVSVITSDPPLVQNGINSRPKACAYDDEKCHKHGPEMMKTSNNQNVHLHESEEKYNTIDSKNGIFEKEPNVNKYVEYQDSTGTNDAKTISNNQNVNNSESNTLDKDKSSAVLDKNNSSVSSGFSSGFPSDSVSVDNVSGVTAVSGNILRGDNVDNRLGDYKKYINGAPDSKLVDKQTQVESTTEEKNAVDGEDPLLPSTTFLTTNI